MAKAERIGRRGRFTAPTADLSAPTPFLTLGFLHLFHIPERKIQIDKAKHNSPNSIRIEIAQRVAERKRQELGEHFIAAACYGSVAHNAAQLYSDLEMLIITDETVPANGETFFEQGIMVDCDMQPASRMLAAAQRVTRRWGIQADQYRHHLVIWDPEQFFPRLWTVANDLAPEAFAEAQQVNWWDVYEMRGKVLNAQLAQDHPRTIHMGWEFAFSAAMHIALHDRQPYESERTIWHDVSARGYGMKELVDVLTAGDLAKVTEVIDNVWGQIKTWGAPEDK